jgi:predicted ABC-type ATPase
MTQSYVARCTILGGTNGSGKSSIFENAARLQGSGEFVNADVVARTISSQNPEAASAAAGRQVIRRLRELIARQQDFVFETTLSSNQSVALMNTARDAGYHVSLLFIVLTNVELNVRRVHERVSRGGHTIPDATIRRRYVRGMDNLRKALLIADDAAIYDNSSIGPEKLIELSAGKIIFSDLDDAYDLHRIIAEAITASLEIPTDAVFGAAKP